MATRICQRCNGAKNILVPNPVPPPKQILVVCPRCNGTGEEEIR